MRRLETAAPASTTPASGLAYDLTGIPPAQSNG
jgi:hypothetical protein